MHSRPEGGTKETRRSAGSIPAPALASDPGQVIRSGAGASPMGPPPPPPPPSRSGGLRRRRPLRSRTLGHRRRLRPRRRGSRGRRLLRDALQSGHSRGRGLPRRVAAQSLARSSVLARQAELALPMVDRVRATPACFIAGARPQAPMNFSSQKKFYTSSF